MISLQAMKSSIGGNICHETNETVSISPYQSQVTWGRSEPMREGITCVTSSLISSHRLHMTCDIRKDQDRSTVINYINIQVIRDFWRLFFCNSDFRSVCGILCRESSCWWYQWKKCCLSWRIIKATRIWRADAVASCSVILLLWRHNGGYGVSNHQPHDSLLNRLFKCRSKKTSKHRVTGLFGGEFTGHRPVTRETFPFDDVIICLWQRRDASVSQDSVCFQSTISSHVRRVLANQTIGWDHSHVTRDGKWTLADFANDGTAYILQAVPPLIKSQQWQIAVVRQGRYLIEEYRVCNITERTW